MHHFSEKPGCVITFYSYNGGAGRTMALANIACLLGRRGGKPPQKALMIDWDLEAPGLHEFFAGKEGRPETIRRPGLIDYFYKLNALFRDDQDLYADVAGEEGWKTLNEAAPVDEFIIPDAAPGVDLMKAGRLDAQYPNRVGSFDWPGFLNRYRASIGAFRELLAHAYSHCLIDSPAGVSAVSGVCAMLTPDKLAGLFTPGRQSPRGLLDLVERAVEYRRAFDASRPLAVFPLPARMDDARPERVEKWREVYQTEFQELFRRIHGLEACDLTAYFDEIRLPHDS
ncbi:MAG: CpsD/CapB family tyrosine-protein kinase, partial [Desulfobacterales bacterium]|nr:CpsD/CapB family tyrosine-protein kinase [Desulfobacterales bacterium]